MQPVWPFSINEDWNVITRIILPVTYVSSGNSVGDTTIPSPVDDGQVSAYYNVEKQGFGADWQLPFAAAVFVYQIGKSPE